MRPEYIYRLIFEDIILIQSRSMEKLEVQISIKIIWLFVLPQAFLLKGTFHAVGEILRVVYVSNLIFAKMDFSIFQPLSVYDFQILRGALDKLSLLI